MQRKQTDKKKIDFIKRTLKIWQTKYIYRLRGSLGANAKSIKMKKEYDKFKQALLFPFSTSVFMKSIDKTDKCLARDSKWEKKIICLY